MSLSPEKYSGDQSQGEAMLQKTIEKNKLFKRLSAVTNRRFGGSDNKRFQVNGFKLIVGIILAAATGTAVHLYDTHRELFNGWSLFGLVGLAVISAWVVGFTFLHGKTGNASLWVSFGLLLLGACTVMLAIAIKIFLDPNVKAIATGMLTFVVIGASLAALAITDWKRPVHRR